ncbi:hypothetical protein [Halobellus rubicundus]|uniref:PIN domain-containing protein n=1 Tax=Halobellus rubicundus TaxID=2996466 RepID=A0ABD5MA27_9EURY
MPDSAAVDTNILVHASDGDIDADQYMESLYILVRLLEDNLFALAIDNEYEILDEYRQNLDSINTDHCNALQEFIQRQVYQKQGEEGVAIHIPIPESQVSELDEMGFHSSDMKFVRIAPATGMEIIASSDGRSFLEDEYKDWIESNLDVNVHDTSEFKEYLDDL